MKNAAAAAIRKPRIPLGETPLAELKTGDLLAIADEEVIELDTDMDGDAVGIIIDMLVMLDEPDMVLLHPPTIPPIKGPTYQINPVSFHEPRNFFLKIQNQSTSMIAGPATMVSSVTVELPLVRTT